MLNASDNYIVKKLRPISSLEGEGFKELANTFIEIGAKHAMTNADNVIPSRFTVKKEIITQRKKDWFDFIIKIIGLS